MPAGLPDAQMLILVEKLGNGGVTTRDSAGTVFSAWECRSRVKNLHDMMDAFRGLYRTVAGAYVTNGTTASHVPEVDYRAFGYEPDFDRLPWQECYDGAKVAHADRDLEHAYDSPDL
jgi:hypothetical protein